MKFDDLVSQLANRINQPHVIETYLRKVWDAAKKDSEENDNWVSVKDKLPKFDGEYLCTVHEIEDCKAEYYRVRIVNFSFGMFVLSFDNKKEVTHWRTLPKRPKP